jgi:hypothetical protein
MHQTLGLIADAVGILGAIFALFSWLQARQLKKLQEQEKIRQNQKIQIVLQHGRDSIELPVELRRAEFTRAEVLGRIGMIPLEDDKQRRFSLKYLNTKEFYKQVSQLIDGFGEGILTISCDEKEFKQFDI